MRIIAALAGVVVGFLLAAGPAAADPPSIADFLNESALDDFAVSPNGERIAAVVDGEGDAPGFVNIVRSSDFEVLQTLPMPQDVWPIWVMWATDDRLLIAIVAGRFSITSSRITLPMARVIAIDADGTDIAVLFDNQRRTRNNINLAVVTDITPDDPDHVLMPARRAGDLDLWKVNIYTGVAERIAQGTSGTFMWRTDAAGNPAFRYDLNLRGTVMRIYTPDAAGEWRQVATVRREDLPEFMPVANGPAPGQAYVIARPEGADRSAVYLYNTVDNTFGEVVASHPRVDVAGVFVNPRTSEYLGYYTFDDVYETHFTDRSLQSHINGLRRFFGADSSFSIVDMSDDRNVWIISALGPSDPGSYYVYNRAERRVEPLAPHNPSLRQEQMGASSVVRYQARDGAEITGYLTLPANAGAGPHPLVMMPHGGPELRDLFIYDRNAQFLASRGYAVFRPNFRGSSGYGRAFAEAGYGEWGGRMQHDVTDALAHLVATGVADPQRVCIMGASYGGYAALAGAAFTPELYKCAISIAGVTDLIDQARHVMRVGDEDEADYIRRSIGDPRADRERLIARSPARQAASIRIPVLLMHGDADDIVPVEQSQRMNRALQQAGKDVRYREFEGEGHSVWSDENETALLMEVETFLARHLGMPPPTPDEEKAPEPSAAETPSEVKPEGEAP